MGKNKTFDDTKTPTRPEACLPCQRSDTTCKDGPRSSCSRCHRLGIACRNKDEQDRPKKKRVIEISDDESEIRSDARSDKRRKPSPMADMVEAKRKEIVAHFGRLGISEEYSNISFTSFRDNISNTFDDASKARSDADLALLDVQMGILRMMMKMMGKADHILEVKDRMRKMEKDMK